jgi:hypothetical protein
MQPAAAQALVLLPSDMTCRATVRKQACPGRRLNDVLFFVRSSAAVAGLC